MSMMLDISSELRKRVEAIATRSNLTASEVIADALERGYSLEWQERFLAKVEQGLRSAENGDFASADEMRAVAEKYRPT